MTPVVASVSGTPAVLTMVAIAFAVVLVVLLWSWVGYRRSQPDAERQLTARVGESVRGRPSS